MADRDRPDQQAGTAAQERGERIETGKAIARGGKSGGAVPGAEAKPPAEPDRSQDEKARAVRAAFAQLGDGADPQAVFEHVKSATGIELRREEVDALRLGRERTPAGIDALPRVGDQQAG